MPTTGVRRMKLALLALLVLGAGRAHALTCATTNTAAPSVVTMMASMTSPATEAWVVTPKCQVLVVPVVKQGDDVRLSSEYAESAVERIESLPSDVTDFGTALQPLTKGVNLAGSTKLKGFAAVMTSGKTIDISFPTSIQGVAFVQGSLTSIDNFKLPDTVTLLRVQLHALTSLKNVALPSALTQLSLSSNKISAIDFTLPPRLEYFDIGSNPITQIEGLTMPDTLISFDCAKCQLTTFKGVRLSASLSTLILGGAITDFEVRQSDLAVLSQLETFTVSVQQTVCSDLASVLLAVRGASICIITELYSNQPLPVAGSSAKQSSSASADGGSTSTSASADTESTKSSETDGSSWIATNMTDSSNPQVDQSKSGVSTSGSKRSQPTDTADSSSSAGSNMNTLLLVVVGSVGFLCVVLIGLIGYRIFFYKKHHQAHQHGKDLDTPDAFVASTTPAADDTANSGNVVDSSGSHSSNPSAAGSQEYLTNDIRNDKLLLPMRIDRTEVVIGRMVARGGYGVIFRGKYDGRDVAIKQMLPDAWRNETLLASFMDEIRLCASLDHPKIVQFVGITWSTLRDLSVLTEFMAGGDLQNVLYNQPSEPQPEDWTQHWSPVQLKGKLSMAVDISEAVVYLHSFPAPIIHRDLKSKNVLLDKRGNAKLSDFGISREMALDETMTSEIGTAAWIAPEVLRGERYSEKADIYSLGVVLVEMDRCRYPYTDEPSLRAVGGVTTRYGNGSTGSVTHKSMQIAVLVSTGRLHPSMTEKAPAKLRELVTRCFTFQPDERPTAMEVGYELRQILREYQ